MGISAVLSEMTLFLLLKVLAHLCLVVVVRDIQHFILDLNWKLLKDQKYHTSNCQKMIHRLITGNIIGNELENDLWLS